MPTENELYPVLQYIRERFYVAHETDYHRDRRQLLRALTWPAAWLEAQALAIAPGDYEKLLLLKLRQIERHGDPAQYRPYFPKYLMKALQDHCHHHREAIYLKLKHAGYTIDRIAADIAAGQDPPPGNHTSILARAHELLNQKHRKNRQTKPTDQMTLGL